MRLASKIFLASAALIVVLFAVGALSLWAIGHLVAVNREITMHTVPAVRLASAAHDAMLGLARLEARFLVLEDARYVTLLEERVARTRNDLIRLGGVITTPRQSELLHGATEAFEAYVKVVDLERALVRQHRRVEAMRLSETEARGLGERVESQLDALMEATHSAALAAQAEAARLEARTWTGVLLALGGAVALALLGTALIAHRLTRSLRTLSAATAAVGAGSFREPVRAQGRDEIADLARAFNAMAAQLRELDELKDAFFATVSHELRSPLTSMREAAHLLREGVPGDLNPKQVRLVAIVQESAERLLRLVNQILDLSRIRAHKLPIERAWVNLLLVAPRAVDELRAQAEEAGVNLEIERVGERFDCVGDSDRLVQIVVNLVSNAVRFTPRGGRVTVRLVDAGPELEMQVEDTGVGIPADALPRIFEWYQQAHHRRGGTGLGLPIVRGLVEAHGGRVLVESQEGKGSRFTVVLPRGKEDP